MVEKCWFKIIYRLAFQIISKLIFLRFTIFVSYGSMVLVLTIFNWDQSSGLRHSYLSLRGAFIDKVLNLFRNFNRYNFSVKNNTYNFFFYDIIPITIIPLNLGSNAQDYIKLIFGFIYWITYQINHLEFYNLIQFCF